MNRGALADVGYEFTYQGRLEDAGMPANGMYDMQFVIFTNTGDQNGSPYFVPDVAVVDGVFTVELAFESDLWVDSGSLQKFLEVHVRPTGVANYTVLSPRTKLTAAPHANIARRLVFPYSDIAFGSDYLEPTFELLRGTDGSVVQFRQAGDSDRPVALVQGKVIYNLEHGKYNGALQVDAPDEGVGILAYGDRISVLGVLRGGVNKVPGDRSAVVGNVSFDSDPNYSAVAAQNIASNTLALLARGPLAGEFYGDVLSHDSVRVRGEILEDHIAFTGLREPARAAPIAYGVINTDGSVASGTPNISSQWDAANSRYIVTQTGFRATGTSLHTILVTPRSTSFPQAATTGTASGEYFVYLWDLLSNTKTQGTFSIMIYDAVPTSTIDIPTATSTTVNDDGLPPGVIRVPAGIKE